MTDPASTWRAGRAGHGRERRTKAALVDARKALPPVTDWRADGDEPSDAQRRAALDDIMAIGVAEGLYEEDEF